ncbi:MAG: hypothetical protein GX090_01440 [Firmicutes bacterium]|nr:hypothetical protein [Bacillota bacterium]HOB34944.1 DHHW family protein [Bacillota bacterium]HPZ90879.1 DHHW family protein [Bacillota bacterium]HQE02107.1 DHHW family protein [Bacillota bacterium]
MQRLSDRLLITAFVLFLAAMLLLNIATVDRAFSERENRYLTRRPELSLSSVFSGRFSRRFEEYITDQFVFRDQWVFLKADVERLLLRTENNGIFLGRDGWLLENFQRPGPALARNIQGINRFADAFPDIRIHVLLAPTSAAVYPEKLPPLAAVWDQRQVLAEVAQSLRPGIAFVPVLDALRARRDEYLYFRTDHHWTMTGAYYAYRELADALGFSPLAPEEFHRETVARDFQGTYSAKANRRRIRGDALEAWRPRTPRPLTITFNDRPGSFDSLFFPRHLEGRNKYDYFLDGNHPLAVIKTSRPGGKLAVCKDSFAHALLPFLAQHYAEIHVIDLRFFTASLEQYIRQQEIDQVLFLYGLSAFASDAGLTSFR